jgi:hypothetical protein
VQCRELHRAEQYSMCDRSQASQCARHASEQGWSLRKDGSAKWRALRSAYTSRAMRIAGQCSGHESVLRRAGQQAEQAVQR